MFASVMDGPDVDGFQVVKGRRAEKEARRQAGTQEWNQYHLLCEADEELASAMEELNMKADLMEVEEEEEEGQERGRWAGCFRGYSN